MHRFRAQTAAAALLFVIVAAGLAFAAGPNLITYQGFLRDANGDPEDGPVNLSFRLYTAATGGTVLWSESHNNVPVDAGLFTVALGSITALNESHFSGAARWLETWVNGNVLTPRRQFMATPYAMRATVADVALSGGDGSWTIDGDNIYRMTGKVGVGTTAPVGKFHIHGTSADEVSIYGQDSVPILHFRQLTGGIDWIFRPDGHSLHVQRELAAGTEILTLHSSGRVGLNHNNPKGSGLHVRGNDISLVDDHLQGDGLILERTDAIFGMYSDGGGVSGSGISFGQISGGTLSDKWAFVRETTSGGAGLRITYGPDKNQFTNPIVMYLDDTGNVGVGTNTPASKLSVSGGIAGETLQASTSLGSATAPATGGVYGDNVVYAWGRINGAGTIESSYGILSVQRMGVGHYRVNFRKPFGAGTNVIPMAIVFSANDPVFARVATTTSNYCEIKLDAWIPGSPGNFVASDYRFLVQVLGRP